MAGKPNARQRANLRAREIRAERTAIPGGISDDERRPLAGAEATHEITRSGQLWSKRLGRFVKHASAPHTNHSYIRVTVEGHVKGMSISRAVVDSWVSDEDLAALRAAVPVAPRSNAASLIPYGPAIHDFAVTHRLAESIVLGFLLSAAK